MAERMFCTGNEAIGRGAIKAGVRHFFGYPITPQNDVPEFFARELPKVGGIYVQSESELASINMLFGAAASGVRAITTTSSPGFSLMQEGISGIASAEIPCVLVNVMRGGPGLGTTQTSQQDYYQTTRGGGNGDYRNIVLAPASVQEVYDLVQLAFHLADKHRMIVILLMDAIVGQMAEPLELKEYDFGSLPEKDWALKGKGNKGGNFNYIWQWLGENFKDWIARNEERYRRAEEEEVRCQTFMDEDADFLMVAYGASARVARKAMELARSEGMKMGLIRPISLWPFPYRIIEEKARKVKKFLVVEDSMGQLIDDVRFAVAREAEVRLVGCQFRHLPGSGGMIYPGAVYQEAVKYYEQ